MIIEAIDIGDDEVLVHISRNIEEIEEWDMLMKRDSEASSSWTVELMSCVLT